ncbi:MAG TPA: hypothetical protein VFW96_03815 [Thermomicrobiales bacterium]|nr:hypothetical protein [Thermomicrobiales bacterium]
MEGALGHAVCRGPAVAGARRKEHGMFGYGIIGTLVVIILIIVVLKLIGVF